MVQNGSKMDQKWVQSVQNGSKTGPKRGPKGGPKGGPKMGPPEVGTKKKVEQYFFSGPSRPKKSPMCLFLRRKSYFWEIFFWEKKPLPYRGCRSGGTTAGGCRARKKSSQKNHKSVSQPKKSARKKSEKKNLVSHTSSTPHMACFRKTVFFLSKKKKFEGKKMPYRGV